MLSCKELFGEYLDNNLRTVFDSTLISDCQLDMENRSLKLKLSSQKYINDENILLFKSRVSAVLKLDSLDFSIEYDNAPLDEAASMDIVGEIRRKNAAINGYLVGANYTISDNNTVLITLCHGGYKKLCEIGFADAFSRLVRERLGLDVSVEFDGQLDDVEINLPPPPPTQNNAPVKQEQTKAVKEPEIEIKYDYKPKYGLPVYLESAPIKE